MILDAGTAARAVLADGVAVLPPMPDLAHAVAAHLAPLPVVDGHVWAKGTFPPTSLGEAFERKWPAFSHRMEDVATAPGFFDLALSAYEVARTCFAGRKPLLYSLNAFWTAPSHADYPDTQSWHRDMDDERQLTLFLFATGAADGPHRYQIGTHLVRDENLGRPIGEPPTSRVATIDGPPGCAVLEDTFGLHRADRPARPRLLLWARWGVSDPPESYRWDKLAPVPRALVPGYPDNPELQEAVRLVAA